jgi:hypothetical protein
MAPPHINLYVPLPGMVSGVEIGQFSKKRSWVLGKRVKVETFDAKVQDLFGQDREHSVFRRKVADMDQDLHREW